MMASSLTAISGAIHCLQKSIIKESVIDIHFNTLIDTGSSISFLNHVVSILNVKLKLNHIFEKYPWLIPLWSSKL